MIKGEDKSAAVDGKVKGGGDILRLLAYVIL